jgi:hypothetical protein
MWPHTPISWWKQTSTPEEARKEQQAVEKITGKRLAIVIWKEAIQKEITDFNAARDAVIAKYPETAKNERIIWAGAWKIVNDAIKKGIELEELVEKPPATTNTTENTTAATPPRNESTVPSTVPAASQQHTGNVPAVVPAVVRAVVPATSQQRTGTVPAASRQGTGNVTPSTVLPEDNPLIEGVDLTEQLKLAQMGGGFSTCSTRKSTTFRPCKS